MSCEAGTAPKKGRFYEWEDDFVESMHIEMDEVRNYLNEVVVVGDVSDNIGLVDQDDGKYPKYRLSAYYFYFTYITFSECHQFHSYYWC